MVIDEPDSYEMDNAEDLDIGIFEPGTTIEKEMDWSNFVRVLMTFAAAWGVMFVLSVLFLIPVIAYLGIDAVFENPWVLIFLSFAEIGFIFPVVIYLRNRGLTLKSVGLKNIKSFKNIELGIIFGFLMFGANLVISFLMVLLVPDITSGDEVLFIVPEGYLSGIWLTLWTIVMFLVVAFSEELLFRGFLQRRMEMYYQRRGSKNYQYMALLLTSLIFAIIHLDVYGLATRFVLGLFLGYLAQKRNYSIVGPTIAHGINNSIVIFIAFLGI